MATENRVDACNDWFHQTARPHAMTGFMLEYLRSHFMSSDSIEMREILGDPSDPAYRATPYTPNDPNSFLNIESVTLWKPSTTDVRPAILVRREDAQIQSIGIGDRLMGGGPMHDGSLEYCVLWAGSLTVFCLARSPRTAELLSFEVTRELIGFKQEIRKKLGLMRFGVAAFGKLFKLEEPAEHYGVPVTVAYVAQQTWRTLPAAPKLKTVKLSALLS